MTQKFAKKKIGPAFKEVENTEYYPTIGLHSQHESIKFVFEIRFKIEDFKIQEIESTRKTILAQSINSYDVHQLVHSYLYYHGYYKTLESFEKISGIPRENIWISSNQKKDNEASPKENNSITNGKNNNEMIEEEIVEETKMIEEIETEKLSTEERTKQKDRDCFL